MRFFLLAFTVAACAATQTPAQVGWAKLQEAGCAALSPNGPTDLQKELGVDGSPNAAWISCIESPSGTIGSCDVPCVPTVSKQR